MKRTYDTDLAQRYLGLRWDWQFREITEEGESYWEATITEIPDFAAYGASPEDLAANLRDAFLSHIGSYLETGKPVPTPGYMSSASYEPRYAAAGGM